MNSKKHTIALESRALLNVTAVEEVVSFDEGLVSLSLGETVLNISGEGLSVKNLSLENGEITVIGKIDAVVYFEDTPRKKRFGLFGK
ncbi:MAG: sporulation protein YabP [Clostridia bacterium]|nr:sporulation protein YabP [Clostridia bacterium]MBQ9848059.1 sporulation protein YabP [Clostridia bacterium]